MYIRSQHHAAFLTLADLVLAICFAVALTKTALWPQISDDVLMHYVVFLMNHGMFPYRQIIDPNMPGSYLVDASVSAAIGVSSIAWRMFDWFLMIIASFSIIDCVGWQRWRAGLFGGLIFSLWHLSDGVAEADQRDFILSVGLLVGTAALFRFRVTHSSIMAFFWGLSIGVATTIKPQTCLLLPAMLTTSFVTIPNFQFRLAFWGFLGWLAPVACIATWLVRNKALGSFVSTASGLMVYHASMARHSWLFLFLHAVPSALLLIGSLCVLQAFRGWAATLHEYAFSFTGILFGVFSFCLQGKAYPYHRYPLLAFFMLFISSVLADSGKSARHNQASKNGRVIPLIILAYGALWLGPSSAAKAIRYDWRDQPSLEELRSDLYHLAGGHTTVDKLQEQVQCMDTMAGCITVLNRMHLVQATGFLYDCYMVAPDKSPERQKQQAQFMALINKRLPYIFVITDQWCFNLPRGYEKLSEWPEIGELLKERYALRVERNWHEKHSKYLATWPFGYRIYVRQTSTPF